ncbi:ATP-dependent helicase HrpB [Paenibacillus rigui]|uniref:ATP-dependent helicase HrpB n=1 Tax=Paenibacillus rigui TaxID=554312 RepID=A0A229UHB1_9BACL|nr:ATP-dependent helicase HrpB [Paenibacillus rigui]OXM82774.1 ATP-dependent helicase HrpB [Paenibacillus rigui]
MTELPIESALPELIKALGANTGAVLVAPPGAGKTTRVPLALLNESWLAGRKILMLEPRRLAARAAARFMASALDEPVGQTVGYRVKLDSKTSPSTRIEVITEGVLTRLLQADPALEDVGLVIFDEFHERSLHADTGLALCLQSQALLRDDLRLLVMSATLDAEPVAQLLNEAPIVLSEGRSYPVETIFREKRVDGRIEPELVRTIQTALADHAGDLLVFLPGEGEIRRVQARLRELELGPGVRITPLYGSLPQEAQDQAIAPSPPGTRKIVLATSIAESSLTVEGVRIVIDSGLMRVPRFSPRTGMTSLATVPVSRASADQRRGRAGRLAPGVCYRLWTEADDRRLASRTTPEMLEADLAALALELAAWGVADPAELLWLDPPPAAAFAQARELLRQLGALNGDGGITPHGKSMAELGLHPRLAHMMLQAVPLQLGELACELAALLNERDMLRSEPQAANADVRLRLEALRRSTPQAGAREASGELPGGEAFYQGFTVDTVACRRIAAEASQWKRALRLSQDSHRSGDIDACGMLLAFAYPDRIGQQRTTGRFLLRNGRGAAFGVVQPLSRAAYLVAASLDDQGQDSRIHLAAPLELQELEACMRDQITEESVIEWDRTVQAVRARKRRRLGALTLGEQTIVNPSPDEALAAVLQGIAMEGLSILPWSKASRQLQLRLQFMHHADPANWPDACEQALLDSMEEWLAPHLYGMRSRADLARLNLHDILEAWLPWEQRKELDAYAPTHFQVPSGSRIAIDYNEPSQPLLSVRLQEMFGLLDTPRIGRGRVPLTLHLLSPASRPVQVTQDLASFWSGTYFEVKKDLKGRYPKHYWPDDPLIAQPTNRVRPRT